MLIFIKIMASIGSWAVLVVIATAGGELYFGEPRPGFVPFFTLLGLVPILFLIWWPRSLSSPMIIFIKTVATFGAFALVWLIVSASVEPRFVATLTIFGMLPMFLLIWRQ